MSPGLTAAHVAELVAELAPLAEGLVVHAVQPDPPRDLLLVLVPPGAPEDAPVRRLRLSAYPDGPRVHLVGGRVRRHAGSSDPFFARCAAELEGARIARIGQVRGDRIVRVELRDTADGRPRALLAELTGRHANLVLCGPADQVLALLVPSPPPKGGGAPRLAPGGPWQAPPGRPPTGDPGPPLGESLPDPPPPPTRSAEEAPLSWRVECALGGAADDAEAHRRRRSLLDRVERRLKRARSHRAGLAQRRSAAEGAERVFQDGELLKAALSEVRRGMESIELADWYSEGAPPRVVALDPKLSPGDNLERLFARAQKLERALSSLDREEALADSKVAALEDLAARARSEDAALDALEAEAVAKGLLGPPQATPERRSKQPTRRLPYKVFRGSAGGEIRVGRTARDNDALTLRHARGNDLWFHTANAPGSHVVLCVEKQAEPDPEEVLDAAHLAVHFSPLRGATRVDVHMARRKEVHKPRGAKPGLVQLSGGRVLSVRVEAERLRRLLSPERSR